MATLLGFIVALSFFSLFSVNTPANVGVKLTEDQAIAVVEQSPRANKEIVSDIQPVEVELRWMKIDWSREDWHEHQRIYVTTTPSGDYSPYWRIEYERSFTVSGQPWIYFGRYIVDATTGELMSAYEAADLNTTNPHPPTGKGDYSITLKPDVLDDPIALRVGESEGFVLKIVGDPSVDAYQPIVVRAVGVRPDLVVVQNVTSVAPGPGGSAWVSFSVSSIGVMSPGVSSGSFPWVGFYVSVKDDFSGFLRYAVGVTSNP